jgi:Tfp pilus assembly protein PilE
VLIGAWLLPVIVGLGIVAAIALPAYQGYTMRAKAAQVERP